MKKALMIPRTPPTWQSKSWQEELSSLISDPETLFNRLNLDRSLLPDAQTSHQLFPIRTTESYLSRIQPGDIDDPLLKQILPIGAEKDKSEGYSLDPLQEQKSNPLPGLIHKYQGRVLLVASPQCAINCRYCFRRHFNYSDNTISRKDWQNTFEYIKNDTSIEEIILSGGDPLVISDRQLSWLLDQIESISHVSRLRIHSRLPIVLPRRITDDLINILNSSQLHTAIVIHCNHPKEIDHVVIDALSKLRSAGIILLNQTVLLKGINDNSKILAKLSKDLFKSGVLPYYIHLLDKVSGTSHFDIKEKDARALNTELLAQLPGYLVPKMVREVAGASSKVPFF